MTGELLTSSLDARERMVVKDSNYTGILELLQATLLGDSGSASFSRKFRTDTDQLLDTPTRVELGRTVNKSLNEPVAELGGAIMV